MFSQSAPHSQEKFTIIQKENSIYYQLNSPTKIKAVEISADLYRAKFYFADLDASEKQDSNEMFSKEWRHRSYVESCVSPELPEIGNVAGDGQGIEIYGMKDYSEMPACNRDHIAEIFVIAEQLHSLEWVLNKARSPNMLPDDLYQKIRIDVRHRAAQLREVARMNYQSWLEMLAEVDSKYIPNANFKRVTTSSDINEFAGKVVAYMSNSYYFSDGDDAITLPRYVLGNKVRFARVSQCSSDWWGDTQTEYGYQMDSFLKPEASGSTHALINCEIKKDSGLAMRVATVQELEFLKLTLELDQGRLGYRNKQEDIKMLRDKIAQASKPNPFVRCYPRVSDVRFFTPRISAAIPPSTSFANGVVDWKQDGNGYIPSHMRTRNRYFFQNQTDVKFKEQNNEKTTSVPMRPVSK